MVKFLDGPAAGQELMLGRIPLLLRVVRSPRGNWDALDQLDDEPKPNETITVYRRRDDQTIQHYFVCRRRASRALFWRASYSVLPDQPADELVRTTAAWRAWATDKLAELYPPTIIPFAKPEACHDR